MAERTTPRLNLTPANGQAGQATPSTGSATGNPRNKVALKPGRSLMDWIRLGHSGRDLTGVGGQAREVTREELVKHNRKSDAWICLKGKVYNVTSYMEYHPGGEKELMTGVGRDATAIFNEVHQWVNAESMLQKCFVGHLDSSPLTLLTRPSTSVRENERKAEMPSSQPEVPSIAGSKVDLCWSWRQDEVNVEVSMSIQKYKMAADDVIVQYNSSRDSLKCRIFMQNLAYCFTASLPGKVDPEIEVFTEKEGVRLCLTKTTKTCIKWTRLDNAVEESKNYLRPEERTNVELHYHSCSIEAKLPVSHDTRLFRLRLPLGVTMETPLGRHVNVRLRVRGIEVCRNFTPVSESLDLTTASDLTNGRTRLHLMVKIYPGGTLTPQLDAMRVGDTIEVSDHSGHFEVSFLDPCRHLVLLAAGTGFTPMVKLVQWALFRNEQRTVKLMFFNKRENDILWKSELDNLAEENPRLEVSYVLSEAEVTWQGHVGRVRRSLLDPSVTSTPPEVTFCCVCGPTPFTQLCLRILEEMKFPNSQIHAFQA